MTTGTAASTRRRLRDLGALVALRIRRRWLVLGVFDHRLAALLHDRAELETLVVDLNRRIDRLERAREAGES